MLSSSACVVCNFIVGVVWFIFFLALKRLKKIPIFASRRHLRSILALQRDLLCFHRKRSQLGEKRLALGRKDGDAHSTKSSQYKKNCFRIRLESYNFRNVLHFDKEEMTIQVEAFMNFYELVSETLKYGCVPLVVPEFRTISVGGAISGLGIESSSFRYGLFHDSVINLELMTPFGEILQVRNDPSDDVFPCVVGSLGTMGFVLNATLRLKKATRRVKMDYIVCRSKLLLEPLIRILNDDEKVEFVDGVVIDPGTYVVVVGRYVSSEEKTTTSLLHFYDRPFIDRIREILGSDFDANGTAPLEALPSVVLDALRAKIAFATSANLENDDVVKHVGFDVIDTLDYFFRFDRGAFFIAGANLTLWKRIFVGPFLDARSLFRSGIYEAPDEEREEDMMVQDVCIPLERLQALLTFVHVNFGVDVLWFCPVRRKFSRCHFALDRNASTSDMHVNVGIYGCYSDHSLEVWERGCDRVRVLEHCVRALKGRKALYAHSYFLKDEFLSMYGTESIREYEVKRRYLCVSRILPHVFDKAVVL